MYFMLCSEHWRIKGARSNKRRKLLICFTNSLFKVYNNLSLRETGPEVYNTTGAHANLDSETAFYYVSADVMCDILESSQMYCV